MMTNFIPDISGVVEYLSSVVVPLWHCAYWDGPHDGMCVFKGEQIWFHLFEENECLDDVDDDDDLDAVADAQTWWRKFALIRLTQEQWTNEHYWHDLFREHVGHHTDMAPDWKRDGKVHYPTSRHVGFYEPARKMVARDLSGNEVLGWFSR